MTADPSHSSRLSTGRQRLSAHRRVVASCLRSTASAQPTVIVVLRWLRSPCSDSSSGGRGGTDSQYSVGVSVALQPGFITDMMLCGVSAELKRIFSFFLWPGTSMFFSFGGGPIGGVWTSRLAPDRAAVRVAANSLSLSLSIRHLSHATHLSCSIHRRDRSRGMHGEEMFRCRRNEFLRIP
jgi:hypothetical protein